MSFQTVILLFISFVFSILGGFITLSARTEEERNLGLGCLAVFATSFFVFVYFAWRKKVFEKQMKENAKSISIEGGKKFHIEKNKIYVASILLFLLGAFLSYFVRLNLIFTILTALLGLIGIILFLGALFGFFFKEYLIFEFDGIRMGFKGYSYIIRWDNIMKISSEEWHSHMAVFFHLINPEDVTRYLFVSKGRRDNTVKKIYSKIGQNMSMTNAHLMILPERFGLDAGYFFRMLEGYLHYPETRKELKQQGKMI